eukprot:scpid16305/ scgid6457/ 
MELAMCPPYTQYCYWQVCVRVYVYFTTTSGQRCLLIEGYLLLPSCNSKSRNDYVPQQHSTARHAITMHGNSHKDSTARQPVCSAFRCSVSVQHGHTFVLVQRLDGIVLGVSHITCSSVSVHSLCVIQLSRCQHVCAR